MNNYCCACGAYLKAPPQPFTIFKLPTSLSLCTILFIHCQSHHHLHSALLLAPHRPNFKFAPQVKQGCFNSGRTKSLHGRSDTNDRRRNHNSSFFIIHFSSFILTHRRQPRTTPRPAPPQFFIFHLSFIKAPPSPLSPSFLSAPFSHFLTASYCCRAHCSPTAYSLSFSCRPLSSPRFS